MTLAGATRSPYARAALVWGVLCAFLIVAKWPAIIAHKDPDPDDTLRLVQVRDWLAGQGWFDLHQYRIDPPHGTLMHWSRLVDVPLGAVIGLFTPLLGAPAAELVALVVVPLVTLGAVMFVAARIAARFFDVETVTFACLALALSPLFVMQVQPMRIDHHGWQVACAMAALLGLLPGRGWRGPALSAAALALGLTISLELLPILAGFGLVFTLRWVVARDTRSLPVFLLALTAASGALFGATHGPAHWAVHCDSLSPPYLALFAVVAGLTAGVAALRRPALPVLIALLGASGVAGVALFVALAPQCSAGPFGNLDPLVRHFWYDNVQEGLPMWGWPFTLAVPVVVAGLAALAVLAHLARTRPDDERQWWREYLAIMIVAFIAGALVLRSQSFVGAFAAVPLGWLAGVMLQRLRNASTLPRRLLAGAAAALVLLPSFPIDMAKALGVGRSTAGDAKVVAESSCDVDHSLPRLNRLPAATFFAPIDIGPSVIELTHHSVVATGHHRAAPAIHDVIAAFIAPPAVAQGVIARHNARYVILCSDLAEAYVYGRAAPHGLAGELLAGHTPPWLEPVDLGLPRSLKLWRVIG